MSGPRWGDGTDDEPLGRALRNWRTAIGVVGSLLSLLVSLFALGQTFWAVEGCMRRKAGTAGNLPHLSFCASVVILVNS